MKLEFEQNIVNADLIEELDFKGFLSLFDLEIPLLPRMILHPFNREQGESHFRKLSDFQALIRQGKLDIEKLISQTGRLPLLDFVIPFFKDRNLEQFHLYTLGRFVSENQVMAGLENNWSLAQELNESCVNIQAVLEKYLKKGFSALRHTPGEQEISDRIRNYEQKLRKELSKYEKEIFSQTGLKAIYPYQKEISKESENISKILNCKLLSATDKENFYLVDYCLPESVEKIIAEKNALSEEFGKLMQDKLKRINTELHPLFGNFSKCYEERKKRVYYYALLWVKNKYSFCFPEFQANIGCRLTKAQLPCLKEQAKEYIPLDAELNQGSNVLFGANMTGKTTVLKTLYFHLTAIQMGLPVPAEAVQLHFPEQVELHLKTSGDIRKNLSSFGEEIHFFTRKMSPCAYILADELFQSTDPVSGTELSEIFLSEYSGKEVVFFCTSHYPDVLWLENISLFRMKDADVDQKQESDFRFEDLLNRIPYELEVISRDKIDDALKQSRKALYIALNFPLPESVKGKIRDQTGISD
ncbi:MAG: hypothetical protein GY795_32725 [Desulfobacterales bacterium]|nr:hypothetical protein [Desulfobacterales bacterium]